MSRGAVLADEMWARVQPAPAAGQTSSETGFFGHRHVLEGIIYRVRTDVPWRAWVGMLALIVGRARPVTVRRVVDRSTSTCRSLLGRAPRRLRVLAENGTH